MTKSLRWQILIIRYSGGTGSPMFPYRIATPEDLNDIGNHQEDWGKWFIVINDIDMNGYTITQPIGRDSLPFTGVFDGKNRKIRNFRWDSNDIDRVGLFGYVDTPGQIKNLGLENLDVNAVNGNFVGGLVGRSKGLITNCSSSGTVSGNDGVSGLVGENYYPGTITNCYSTGSVSGNKVVGGLVGSNRAKVINCYSTGSVFGSDDVGGLVGYNRDGTITNCYSVGRVSAEHAAGGLLGHHELAEVEGSYWDIQTSGQSWSASGEPKTTAEMKTMSTFTEAGWDFVNVWDICEGTNYPRLRWQIPPARARGDFLCPYGVDFVDFAVLALAWQTKPNDANWNPACDISQPKDNFIDELDLAVLCENWLEGTTP
jgi:hypothetical protein